MQFLNFCVLIFSAIHSFKPTIGQLKQSEVVDNILDVISTYNKANHYYQKARAEERSFKQYLDDLYNVSDNDINVVYKTDENYINDAEYVKYDPTNTHKHLNRLLVKRIVPKNKCSPQIVYNVAEKTLYRPLVRMSSINKEETNYLDKDAMFGLNKGSYVKNRFNPLRLDLDTEIDIPSLIKEIAKKYAVEIKEIDRKYKKKIRSNDNSDEDQKTKEQEAKEIVLKEIVKTLKQIQNTLKLKKLEQRIDILKENLKLHLREGDDDSEENPTQKSGEINDPFINQEKLNMTTMDTETLVHELAKNVHLPKFPFWNYWTYQKNILEDDCPKNTVKIRHVCVNMPPH